MRSHKMLSLIECVNKLAALPGAVLSPAVYCAIMGQLPEPHKEAELQPAKAQKEFVNPTRFEPGNW